MAYTGSTPGYKPSEHAIFEGNDFIYTWGDVRFTDRSYWLAHLNEHARYTTIKPPTWWVEAQEMRPERKGNAKFAIWNKRYSIDKKLAAWAAAPDADFMDAGYGHLEKDLR